MKTAYATLKNARAIVATRWTKKFSGTMGGPRCALGAMNEAATGIGGFNGKAYVSAVDALRKVITPDPRSQNGFIATFNDHPDTTQQDVVDAFTKAMRAKR